MSAGELGRPMRLAAPRTRLRVSFGQALALSLALHAALAAPFGLATLWPARDAQDDEALVGKATAGSAANSFTHRRNMFSCRSRSRAACATLTSRSRTNLTASTLNSRLN